MDVHPELIGAAVETAEGKRGEIVAIYLDNGAPQLLIVRDDGTLFVGNAVGARILQWSNLLDDELDGDEPAA